jgi:hypothetical protein
MHPQRSAIVRYPALMSGVLRYVKPERFRLKDAPEFSERWLQDLIVNDPSVLGLGDLEVRARERQQAHAGRLDLLLADTEDEVRYEVELMLGPTDESHIIRCIEYWDIERRRYPGHEHCAVLVAEDITSRFLNVISLLSGTIPIIAIQLNALRVEERVVLDFVRVIDRSPLREDEEPSGAATATNREYWLQRCGVQALEIVDAIAALVNLISEAKYKDRFELKYMRQHVGLSIGGGFFNVAEFNLRKQFVRVRVSLANEGPWFEKIRDAGLEASRKPHRLRVNLTRHDLEVHRALIEGLMETVVDEYHQ